MPIKPVIFLAFANDREDNAKYLRNLPVELSQIREALKEAEKNNLCEVVERANVSINAIFDIFQDNRYRDRIAIFHYGGHADSYQLLLENLDLSGLGNPTGLKQTAHGEGLVSFLSKQKGLTLVFFNGAVIGTSSEIDDTAATQLATRFYKGLGQQMPLQQAWEQAIDEVKTIKGDKVRGLYRKESNPQDKKGFPWEIYSNDEQATAWKLEIATNEHYVFNEYLIKTLIPALKDYSLNAQNFLQQVKNIPEWEKKSGVKEHTNDILQLFVGVIGIQIKELIVIGELEEQTLDIKQRKYFKKCVQLAKILLSLLGFVFVSKLWDYKKGGSSLQHTERLKDFFETNLDFSLQKKLHFLSQLYQIFNQNNLDLPFEELKVLGNFLREDHSFYKNCQILNDLQNSFEKSTSISSVEIAQAEQSLTYLLSCLPFLVRFKMSSIRQISYRHTRNAEPYFIHHYLHIDNKKKESDSLKLDSLGFFTEAVLFHKGLDYKNHINLFPFVIDYNAIMLENLDNIYFFNNVDLNNRLEYVSLTDDSKINIELSHIQEKELVDILKDKEKHKKFNLDNVFLVFQQAKEAILGNNTSAQGLDFQMIDE